MSALPKKDLREGMFMPKWGWWVAAVLLFTVWNISSIGVDEYWFGGWWRTVRHRPLGAWHAADVIPFIAAYLAIRDVIAAVPSGRKVEQEVKPGGTQSRN